MDLEGWLGHPSPGGHHGHGRVEIAIDDRTASVSDAFPRYLARA